MTLNSRPTAHLPPTPRRRTRTVTGPQAGLAVTGYRPRPASCGSRKPQPGRSAPLAPAARSEQIAQSAQADLLSAHKGLAVGHADTPTPVTGAVTDIVQECRRGLRPTGDELRLIARQRAHLVVMPGGNVEHKRRLGVHAEVDTEVIKNPLRVMRLAGQIRLRELRPEA